MRRCIDVKIDVATVDNGIGRIKSFMFFKLRIYRQVTWKYILFNKSSSLREYPREEPIKEETTHISRLCIKK